MNTFSKALCASVLVAALLAAVVRGESRLEAVLESPKFFVGCQVIWSDGSRGKIVMQPELREGQWFYSVQLGGVDGLCWSLPESGLRLNPRAG